MDSGKLTPCHNQSTSDGSWGVLCSIYGHSRSLCTHTNTHEQSTGKLLLPGVTESGTNNGPDTEVSSEEDDTTAAEVVVDGVREPATDETKRQLVKSVSVMNKRRLYV